MRLIRFVLARRHPESGVEDGAFRLAYELRESPHLEEMDREILAENLTWFEKNLETPTRFNRTKSKGFYRTRKRLTPRGEPRQRTVVGAVDGQELYPDPERASRSSRFGVSSGERRMVDLTSASWNRVTSCLRQIDQLCRAA